MFSSHLKYLITSLNKSDSQVILDHLLRLNSNDRYLRFFAVVNDSALQRYVSEVINFKNDKLFGIFSSDKQTLIAFAHLTLVEKSGNRIRAELGISIDAEFRDRGLAKRLMDRIVVHCRAHDIGILFMSCLRQNKKMQKIAQRAGMKVLLDHEEAIAELNLVDYGIEKATSISREIAYEQIAIVDKCYRLNAEILNILLKKL